ncbi:MAG: MFS transporter [Micropruina sp.]
MTRPTETVVPSTTTTIELRRARPAVSVLFMMAGTVMGGWAGRIPSVRGQLGVSDGEWGLIVLAAPIGVLRLAPSIQLAASSLLLAVLFLATLRFLPDTRRGASGVPELHEPLTTLPEPVPSARSWTPQLILLAAIGFLSSINEGGAVQWSALYAVSLGGGIAIGSVTLVCYSMAIAAVRLVGDRIIEAVGRRRFLQLSAAVSVVGMGIGLLVGSIPAAIVGFACVGIGSGCIVPVVMTLAGNQPTVPSAKAVALISLGEWPAFLLGPPVIGGLAELFGLRGALGVIVLAAAAIIVLATFVRERTVAATC